MCDMSGYRIPSRIETERLVIRRYVEADAEQLAAVVTANIDHLKRFMEWIKHEPQSVEQRREWIAEVNRKFDAGEDYTLGIFEREAGGGASTYIGGTGFHVKTEPDRLEIGYWIDKDHEGKGLVTEAAAALTRVALEYAGAEIVDITHAPANERSAAIPQRLGYNREADSLDVCHDSGEMLPSVRWRAHADTLVSEALASTPRPHVFAADGTPRAWRL
jgi:RimJ/RimL family protein N-acetyltransferase